MVVTSESNQTTAYAGTKRRLKIWFFFIALFMAWALYTLFSQMDNQGRAELKLSVAQNKITAVTQQMDDLKLQVARLNDKEYIGQLATKEQGMLKKGETLIQVEK